MHVNRRKTGRWDSNPSNVPPPATTSHDARIGRFSRPNSQPLVTPDNRARPDACALNVPCDDREPDSRWRWLGGVVVVGAVFVLAAAAFVYSLAAFVEAVSS